jgi:hypothetical protein
MAAQGALRDPFINEAINKLIAAGVVKMAWWTSHKTFKIDY